MASQREKKKMDERLRTLKMNEKKTLEVNLRGILQKNSAELTEEDKVLLSKNEKLASELATKQERRKQQKAILEDRKLEKMDSAASLYAKVSQLCSLIQESKKKGGVGGVVMHTGAGLSTAAGIPDFRGPQGVWTLKAKGQSAKMDLMYEETRPTKGHMVIAELVRLGFVSHVVTQNVDGLHRRSGVSPENQSEIHGCIYKEKCSSCGAIFLRPFDVTQPQGTSFRRHKTGRTCGQPPSRESKDLTKSSASTQGNTADMKQEPSADEKPALDEGTCGGNLVDTIIHFGESIDLAEILKAEEASSAADIAICLGTSLKVPPANKLPGLAKKVVVVNLQWTAMDKHAEMKIHAKADDVLAMMANMLGVMEVPDYDREQDPVLMQPFLERRPELVLFEEPEKKKEGSKRKGRSGAFSFPRPSKRAAT